MSRSNSISHDFQDETIESKTLWFRGLPLSERMEMLCEFTDLALFVNPHLMEKKDAEPIAGRIQVISNS